MLRIVRFIPYVVAGMIGGAFVHIASSGQQKIATEKSIPALAASYVNVSPSRNAAIDNFVLAANLAMPVVVHINASESDDLARRRYREQRQRNPWGMMEDDFFFGFPQFGGGIQRKQGSGSGVIFRSDGYILTNNHVVEFADQISVTTFDNRKFSAKVIGTDPKTDLAVLQIDAKGLPVLPFADSDEAQVGEWVLAVGNPFDLTSTVTAGIISAKGRNIDIIKSRDAVEAFIQTDAAVNPGNSGGALVDVQGHLLGINTAIATKTGYYSGYSFAIPINMARRIGEDLIEYGYAKRARLGLSVVELDGSLAKELGLVITQGLVVEHLEEGGAAELAGLRPMDVIVEVNGRAVKGFPDLQEQAGQVRPGDKLLLNIYRNGKYLRYNLHMN